MDVRLLTPGPHHLRFHPMGENVPFSEFFTQMKRRNPPFPTGERFQFQEKRYEMVKVVPFNGDRGVLYVFRSLGRHPGKQPMWTVVVLDPAPTGERRWTDADLHRMIFGSIR